MCVRRTAEGESAVSECEVLVMFVTADGECTARNISEWYKIVKSWKVRKKIKEK